jgi:hypothetical protein
MRRSQRRHRAKGRRTPRRHSRFNAFHSNRGSARAEAGWIGGSDRPPLQADPVLTLAGYWDRLAWLGIVFLFCSSWSKGEILAASTCFPLLLQQRTLLNMVSMSVLCHKRK